MISLFIGGIILVVPVMHFVVTLPQPWYRLWFVWLVFIFFCDSILKLSLIPFSWDYLLSKKIWLAWLVLLDALYQFFPLGRTLFFIFLHHLRHSVFILRYKWYASTHYMGWYNFSQHDKYNRGYDKIINSHRIGRLSTLETLQSIFSWTPTHSVYII